MQRNRQENFLNIELRVQANGAARFILSPGWLAFFYGTYLYLYELRLVRDHISVIHPILIIWAAVLTAYNIMIRKMWRKLPFSKTLTMFSLAAAVTGIVNLQAGGIQNLKAFALVLIPLCVFYPLCVQPDAERRKKELLLSAAGLMSLSFLASIAAVVLFLLDVSQKVTVCGREYLIGIYMYGESAIVVPGIYIDTNHAACFAVLSALLGLMLFTECRRGLFKNRRADVAGMVFGIADLAVQALYFPLANSRGGWLSLIAAILAVVFFFAEGRLRGKGFGKSLKAAGCAAAAATLCVLLLLGLRGITSASFRTIETLEEKTEGVQLGFDKGSQYDDDTGAGRTVIWKEALSLYAERPAFGIGPGNSAFYASAHLGEKSILASGKAVHNSYLDLLLDYGALGFLLLMGFFVQCIIKTRKLLKCRASALDADYYIALCGVVMIACSSFFLSCVFINCTATYFTLLTLLGYLLAPELPEKVGSENG